MTDTMHDISRQSAAPALGLSSDMLDFCALPQQGWMSSDDAMNGENFMERLVSNTSRFAGLATFALTVAGLTYLVI